ncbi:MAG: hypothetical protein ACRBK7_05195 [Acidimicrobiales bacterium]
MTTDDTHNIDLTLDHNSDHKHAASLDCGDGVPALVLEQPRHETRAFPADGNKRAHITAKSFAIGATMAGQLLIALSVAAGGSALVGVFAAITLMLCGLGVVLTEVVNAQQR